VAIGSTCPSSRCDTSRSRVVSPPPIRTRGVNVCAPRAQDAGLAEIAARAEPSTAAVDLDSQSPTRPDRAFSSKKGRWHTTQVIARPGLDFGEAQPGDPAPANSYATRRPKGRTPFLDRLRAKAASLSPGPTSLCCRIMHWLDRHTGGQSGPQCATLGAGVLVVGIAAQNSSSAMKPL